MENYLKRILEAALRSPSGDNCQPFRYKIADSSKIEIHHNEQAGKHFFNSDNYASLLALGTSIESMMIESRGLGLTPTIQLTKELGSTQIHHWATLQLSKAEKPIAEDLVGLIDKRWTCRFPFSTEKIPNQIVRDCKTQVLLTSSKVELHYEQPMQLEFIDFIKKSDLVLWKHQEAAIDLLKKIRFSSNNESAFGDGMSGFELGIKDYEMFLMRFIQAYPSLIPFFYKAGLKHTALRVSEKNYKNSAGLFAFAIPIDIDPIVGCVEAGRAALRVWMHLNKLGYVVQPVTPASMLCFQNRNKSLTPLMKPEYVTIYNNGTQLWKKYFGVGENSDVIWALRVGLPLQNIQPHRSKRLKIEDIIMR